MGFSPAGAASAEQAMRILNQQEYPVIVVDLTLPGAGGMTLVQNVRQRWPNTQVIILTGFGDLAAAREAIHLDVVDFLTKPCALGDLEIALGRAFRRLQQLQPSAFDPKYDERELEEAETVSAHSVGGTKAMAFSPRDGSEALSMEEVERKAIFAALEKHCGNRAATAAELGISLRKLYYRLGEYQKKGLMS
jgi:DNA-binding NtrC family response regulator